MEKERLKIWLDFSKYIVGPAVIGVFSIILNSAIETSRLNLDKKMVENEHNKYLIDYYMKSELNIEKKIVFFDFLVKVTSDKNRKKIFNSLLEEFKDKKTEQDSLENNKNEVAESTVNNVDLLDIKANINKNDTIELSRMKKSNASKEEISELENKIKIRKILIDSLECEIESSNKRMTEKGAEINIFEMEVSKPIIDTSSNEINTLFSEKKFIIQKGHIKEIKSIGVSFRAQKVNNLTKRALIEIERGEGKSNLVYSLKVNRFCVFSKNNVEYKLLVNKIETNGTPGESKVTLLITKY